MLVRKLLENVSAAFGEKDFPGIGTNQPTFVPQAQAAGAAVIEKIQQDYPQGLKNRLHEFLAKIEVSA